MNKFFIILLSLFILSSSANAENKKYWILSLTQVFLKGTGGFPYIMTHQLRDTQPYISKEKCFEELKKYSFNVKKRNDNFLKDLEIIYVNPNMLISRASTDAVMVQYYCIELKTKSLKFLN